MPRKRLGDPHPRATVLAEDNYFDGAEEDDDGEDDYGYRYTKARALHEEEKHQLARLKRLEEEGRLVDGEKVRLDFANIAATLRQRLRAIPARAANSVYAADSPQDVVEILVKEIDVALHELADAVNKIGRPEDDDAEDEVDET